MTKNINNILIPNVTKTSNQKKVDVSNRLPKNVEVSEFKSLLDQKIEQKPLHGGISLSTHAAKRLEERKIDFNGDEYTKVKDAIGKLRAKGGQNSLIVSDKAAYIVDVKNNKLVTAVDKGSMSENIFTKIDSTMFIN
ncbi:MAG: TIGR02530 family flagellar biosynthesis protein [Bacteriovoracaceae bacterium]|nr:flagellar protein [Halobacteriovoraceae bacterium]MDP7320737.1 TIGR02530 family flagellar biosynthesis protein [Bacteriovoracaceae bacterium]